MNYTRVAKHISSWLSNYHDKSKTKGFVIGISGGVDSSVVSALCAMTGLPVIAVRLPIESRSDEMSGIHAAWLENYPNVKTAKTDLTEQYKGMLAAIGESGPGLGLAAANLASRLRMCALYHYANANEMLVVGTGNKVEDFGVGFFTKYGDGGVDLSPIADLTKTEVWAIARELGIDERIIKAKPTDDLWPDCRTDEDQIGATYEELEWAMAYHFVNSQTDAFVPEGFSAPTDRQLKVYEIYLNRHNASAHKMVPPPVCQVPRELFIPVVVRLIGGIGAGKSTVCKGFEKFGIPSFDSDAVAKEAYKIQDVQDRVTDLLGDEVWNTSPEGRTLNTKLVSSLVFADRNLLKKLMDILRPHVRQEFRKWLVKQTSPYVLYETALLEVEGETTAILVSASEETRIERVMQRNGMTREDVLARIRNQPSESIYKAAGDFEIINEGSELMIRQIMEVHLEIMERIGKS